MWTALPSDKKGVKNNDPEVCHWAGTAGSYGAKVVIKNTTRKLSVDFLSSNLNFRSIYAFARIPSIMMIFLIGKIFVAN